MIEALSTLILSAILGATMSEEPRAITLDATRNGDIVEVQLKGASDRTQAVSYSLEVTGDSSSRHRGRTTLAANSSQVLSTVKVSANGEWCARVTVEEEDRAPYELTEGSC